MAFISTGLPLCSMPKPWQRCPLPIIHSLPIPERGRAGWLPSTLAPGLEETMCWAAKRWKQSWGFEAPNRCIPWGDNGAKSHLARKHMQDLWREAGAERSSCLGLSWGRGRGTPSETSKLKLLLLRAHKDLPHNPTSKTSPPRVHSFSNQLRKDEHLCPQSFEIASINST